MNESQSTANIATSSSGTTPEASSDATALPTVTDPGCCGGTHAAEGTACGSEAPVNTSTGGVADEAAMIDALRSVIDPELFINVVDLGLVYGIQQTEDKVQVEMTLTSPACPAGPQLVQQAKLALERLPGISEATIKLVLSPPWSPARMTDEARDQLGIF